jgi:plastocyanin
MNRLAGFVLVVGAAVALAACGSASSPSSPSSPALAPQSAAPSDAAPTAAAPSTVASACQQASDTAGGVAVEIKNFSFNPGTIEAKVGQAITFTNADSARHGAALDDGSCSTGAFGNGGSGSLVFSAAGTYTFHCPVHPDSMTGTIKVS